MSVLQLSKHMSNSEIAEVFSRVAEVLQIRNESFFRIRAYERAAENIRYLNIPLRQIWERGELEEVGGIGETFHEYLDELFRTGNVKHFENLFSKMPSGMFPLINLPGVGAKKAFILAKTFKLEDPETVYVDVAELARAGKISALPRFGTKSEAQILAAVSSFTQETKRYFLPEAQAVASVVLEYLRAHPAVEKAESLGSLRRQVPTIGDVDIAVLTTKPHEVMEHVVQFPGIKHLLVSGDKMTRFIDTSTIQVDVKTQDHLGWGSMLQHYTGSREHNIRLRTLAKEKGWSLSEHGMKKQDELVRYESEESLYADLGMPWVPPELREARGEVEAALVGTLPQLVEADQIKGDLHTHLNLEFPSSHDMGASTVAQMLEIAMQLGYEYVGFSDHNPKTSGLSPAQRLEVVRRRTKQIREQVRAFAAEHERVPEVFIGLEVDIRPDGSLALENEALAEIDYAVASIHSQFRQSKQETTERVLRALSHAKVRIWGHPSSRHLLKRPELELEWGEVFAFCAQHHKLIEVNSSPKRLDLPDGLIKEALKQQATLIINTDAHHASQMHLMPYGVAIARRGWAQASDVANTRPLADFKKMLLNG